MPSAQELYQQAAKEARLVDRITADFADDLSGVLTGLNRQVRSLIAELETTGKRLVATKASLGRALRLRGDLTTALQQAGYPDLVALAVDAPLDRLAALHLEGRSIAATAAKVTPVDVDVLVALKEIRQADLLDLGDQMTTALWRSTVDGVLGLRQVPELVEELASVVDVSERQARTLHDTAVSTYGRQVDQLGLDGGLGDRFLYVGPGDSETRPFCREWLGQVLTRQEIGNLSNRQLPNVLLTAGGYNCRHKWQYIGTFSLKELGVAA